jgi:precorrin-6A/cobalt-precorrin-6A reductase
MDKGDKRSRGRVLQGLWLQHSPSGAGGTERGAMILLLSGTSEGRILSARLRAGGVPFVASVTTPEARQLFAGIEPAPEVLVTRFSGDALGTFVRERRVSAILDATHPFAQRISESAIQAAAQEHIPYVRYERPARGLSAESGEILVSPTIESAAKVCREHGTRIFVTTGAKTLYLFREVIAAKHVVARILPTVASLSQALETGLPPAQILALRGPFSQELEYALLRQYHIDLLVTKDSGAAGGLETKLTAAAALHVPAVVVSRPQLTYPNLYHDLEQAVQTVIALMGEDVKHG